MIITRFAPSPTGYLHIGGARTALFSWLLAKHNDGRFVLRIEDTDQKRNTATAAEQVIKDLKWLGIDWDEGPDKGGENSPYYQSERKNIYDKYINQLLETGKAYYCFDTAEDLEKLRKRARKEKKNFNYPRPQEFPTAEDAEKAEKEGKPVTVRFAVPRDEKIVINDIVRGKVEFAPEQISDFIIRKSDGFPTYNFACVVDDKLMGVTHIVRGQEHLMNTPGQQCLWGALFDTDFPAYVHMSVTVSEGGGKLSKRERPKRLLEVIKSKRDQVDIDKLAEAGGLGKGELEDFINGKSSPDMPAVNGMAEFLGVKLPEINVVDFFKSGYLPETMVNFLALLGWNPGDDREIMGVEELVESFDVSRLTKSNSLFDRKKLLSFNTEHIRRLIEQDIDKLVGHFRVYLEEIDSPVKNADHQTLQRLLKISSGARTLADIEKKSRFLFYDNDNMEYNPKAVKKVLKKEGALGILRIIRGRLDDMDEFSEKEIEDILRGLADEKGVGLGKVAQPLRVSIAGDTVSPPIFDSVQMLGMDNVLKRIDNTLEKFENEND
jgi:glutamyl/glutaminyl-tRNA synthetase